MTVSLRHIKVGLAGLAGTIFLATGVALAGGGCCGGSGMPTGPGIGAPTTGGGAGSPGCCGNTNTHGVIVPGVSVPPPSITVTTPNVVVGQGGGTVGGTSFVAGRGYAGGSAGSGGVFVYGGGGGYYDVQGVAPSAIGGLNVVGGEEMVREIVAEQIPVTQTACVERVSQSMAVRPVQAVCLDDMGAPYPASRVDDTLEVDPNSDTELFRCMAGTSMQVTLGDITDGEASFAQGESFTCDKGEALVHKPGGRLACAPQAPQRNCNERSLLRRYGPGIKMVTTLQTRASCEPQTRTVMQTVEREVVRAKPNPVSPIVFDGGVGQGFN